MSHNGELHQWIEYMMEYNITIKNDVLEDYKKCSLYIKYKNQVIRS